MPRDNGRNLADVLSETLLSVPGILQQGADVKNKQLLQNLELMTGAQERKAKSKHQRFMEEIAAAQAQRQQTLFEERDQPEPETELDLLKTEEQRLKNIKLEKETAQIGLPKPDKPEDPQKATKALIDKIVASRATKTKKVKGIESITPEGTGFLGTGIFKAKPETTFVDQQVPSFDATELQSLFENLSQAFGITPSDTTQGFDFNQIQNPTTDVLGRPFTPSAESTGVSTGALNADEQKELELLRKKHGR